MIVVPAIDVRDGRCVRLLQGDYAREVRYEADPAATAAAYARAGARLVHMVDLDAARDGGRKNADVIAAMAAAARAAGAEVQVGGGLRSPEAVQAVLDAGASFAVVGTLAAERPDALHDLVARFGPRVVLGLDARDGVVAVRGWEASAGVTALDLGRRARAAGVERAVYTNVAHDGTLQGPDVEGGRRLQEETGLLVTLSGGVGDLEHVRAAARAGLFACIVGRALLEGRFTLEAALAAAQEA
ncbi:MAG: HisA/HisF-related TIM barrel protein [Planctomycetes bacterium]|nr:HisA/HisF-related TIM barrel protein [Planctomycetota bacterium]